MPWPNFTELSFGYCFLRELEQLYTPTGKFPTAPDFISQHKEKSAGYDVKVLLGTKPFFFQFKRSFRLTTANARPMQDGHFSSLPIFRMHYHDNDHYAQHKALVSLESSGNEVYYVTSQISNHDELSILATTDHVVDSGAALFSPIEATPPNYTEDHCICFTKSSAFAVVYSQEPRVFQRKAISVQEHFAAHESTVDRSLDENRRDAKLTVSELLKLTKSTKLRTYIKTIDDPISALSIAAFLILGASLTYLRFEE
jgi:hypothetical protein